MHQEAEKPTGKTLRELKRDEELKTTVRVAITNRHMMWHSRETFLSVKNMSTPYIRNILTNITNKKNTTTHYSGHTKENWISSLSTELRYRNTIADAAIMRISEVCNFDFTKICNEQLQRFDTPLSTRTVKV